MQCTWGQSGSVRSWVPSQVGQNGSPVDGRDVEVSPPWPACGTYARADCDVNGCRCRVGAQVVPLCAGRSATCRAPDRGLDGHTGERGQDDKRGIHEEASHLRWRTYQLAPANTARPKPARYRAVGSGIMPRRCRAARACPAATESSEASPTRARALAGQLEI